jgi:hypothetical protein
MNNAVLERFQQHTAKAEKHIVANKFTEQKTVPTKYIKGFAYISQNDFERKYLMADIDRPTNKMDLCKDYGLFEPTIICYSKDTRRAHCFWELVNGVSYQPRSRKKPQKLFEVVQQDLIIVADADPNFTSAKFFKNPLNPRWDVETFDKQYELKEFLDLSPILTQTYFNKVVVNLGKATDDNSRDCYIFEIVRHKGYRAVHKFSSKADFYKFILNECEITSPEASNTLGKPLLPGKEIKKIARSISDWIWQNRHKIDGKNRGVCGFEPSKRVDEELEPLSAKEIRQRQQVGAAYTASLKSNKTMDLITNAIQFLGANASKIDIAKQSGVPLKTVYRYI